METAVTTASMASEPQGDIRLISINDGSTIKSINTSGFRFVRMSPDGLQGSNDQIEWTLLEAK